MALIVILVKLFKVTRMRHVIIVVIITIVRVIVRINILLVLLLTGRSVTVIVSLWTAFSFLVVKNIHLVVFNFLCEFQMFVNLLLCLWVEADWKNFNSVLVHVFHKFIGLQLLAAFTVFGYKLMFFFKVEIQSRIAQIFLQAKAFITGSFVILNLYPFSFFLFLLNLNNLSDVH